MLNSRDSFAERLTGIQSIAMPTFQLPSSGTGRTSLVCFSLNARWKDEMIILFQTTELVMNINNETLEKIDAARQLT